MIDTSKSLVKEILTEQFIPDHVFLYVAAGKVRCYDGDKSYTFKAAEYYIARKNRLARYTIENTNEEFEPIIICLEEAFFKNFEKKHKARLVEFKSSDTFIKINETELLRDYIHSLKPYYKGPMEITEAFEDVKCEELLIILLKTHPELAGVFFNYGIPAKVNLEAFMNKNYKFNVSTERFAYLTGRSLSAFKRDFKTTFNNTPNQWLMQKRLEEAHYLISKRNKKSTEIYLDLGFEALSHFSYSFKKKFGLTPTELQFNSKVMKR